jgi:hypothetical protein
MISEHDVEGLAAKLTEGERLSRIGQLAAVLCYADRCPADNICIGSCAAVVPETKYLKQAAEQVFREYWASRPAALRSHLIGTGNG